jgi:hypothetical protein
MIKNKDMDKKIDGIIIPYSSKPDKIIKQLPRIKTEEFPNNFIIKNLFYSNYAC